MRERDQCSHALTHWTLTLTLTFPKGRGDFGLTYLITDIRGGRKGEEWFVFVVDWVLLLWCERIRLLLNANETLDRLKCKMVGIGVLADLMMIICRVVIE